MNLVFALMLLAAPDKVRIVSSCSTCHRPLAAAHAQTWMSKAQQHAPQSPVLTSHPDMSASIGPFLFRIQTSDGAAIYSASRGANTVSVPLLWALGAGELAQTYIFERGGSFFESRASFYRAVNGLDLTIGHEPFDPKTPEEALGRRLTQGEVIACFGCYSASSPVASENQQSRGSASWIENRIAGVQCENCHADSWRHAAGLLDKAPAPVVPIRLKGSLAEEISQLCGACHKTYEDVKAHGPSGIHNVRLQPYRLTLSKCYDPSDARIACTACHDPHHREMERVDSKSYDKACLACHRAPKKTCPVAKADCVSCHMPRYEIPGSYFRFSDHNIRVARPGAPYPD